MKFTISWLKEHLQTDASLETITETLTAIGLEVEEVADRAAGLDKFIVASIIDAWPHPDAKRLQVCKVDTGAEIVQVVCGAPNARSGLKSVYAPVGSLIPSNGMSLKISKIRGVESHGMLCSEREMGISNEQDGIIELPKDSPLGGPFASWLGLDDAMIEIAITPNRQDCLGVRGIARDLAAAGIGSLKQLNINSIPGRFLSPIDVNIGLANGVADACPMFVGRYVRGVKNGPSPRWLQDRLSAIGLRPISALVDLTNYITYDLGRPLHVFDADCVSGNIQVRLSQKGETLTALNDRTYILDSEVTVIADDQVALAMGGIIGGAASGCTEMTTNVFIESALFDPIRTASTGRRYSIDSDARYRFERGVDPSFARQGLEFATQMLMNLCGGEPSDVIVSGELPNWKHSITLRPSRVRCLGGIDISLGKAQNILESLGFGVAAVDNNILATVPSWRSDIVEEVDLIEEIMRIYGFDQISSVSMPTTEVVTRTVLSNMQRRIHDAKRILAARGLLEAVTWSFTSSQISRSFGKVPSELKVANPISSDLDIMRSNLLPNLLLSCGRNIHRGENPVTMFEVGAVYEGIEPENQLMVAAGLRYGLNSNRHWAGDERSFDVFDSKADVQSILHSAGLRPSAAIVESGGPDWYHPGRSGVFKLGPKITLAYFGEIHPQVLQNLGIDGPVMAFEIFLESIPHPRATRDYSRPRLEVSDLPAVRRDFAFVMGAEVSADHLLRAVAGVDKELVKEISVFDVFEGGSLEPGKKSLAISVCLQPLESTLTELEIESVSGKIVTAIEKATGGSLRQ